MEANEREGNLHDLVSRDDLPKDWIDVIAVRASLRALPAVGYIQDSQECLNLFRINFLIWAKVKYANLDIDDAIKSAISDIIKDKESVKSQNTAKNKAVYYSIDSAELSAKVLIGNPGSRHIDSALCAFQSSVDTSFFLSRTGDLPKNMDRSPFRHIGGDLTTLRLPNEKASNLLSRPLWLEDMIYGTKFSVNIPIYERKAWDIFADGQIKKLGLFDPWVAWYRSLLGNKTQSIARNYINLDAAEKIVTKPTAWWKNDPKIINYDMLSIVDGRSKIEDEFHSVKEFLYEKEMEDIQSAIESIPSQSPAAFRFHWSEGKLRADAPNTVSTDMAMAQDMLDELRRKSEELLSRIKHSNISPELIYSVTMFRSTLPESVTDLRPGILRSRSRSIEAFSKSFLENSQEIMPSVLASLVGLSETCRDMQGFYPEIREIEAEVLALDLQQSHATSVRRNLDRVIESVSGNVNLVHESSVSALKEMRDISSEDGPSHVQFKRIAEYALVVRNFLSPLVRSAAAEAIQGIGSLSKDVWDNARPKMVEGIGDGVGAMAKSTVIVGASLLLISLASPIVGIAAAGLAAFGKFDALIKLLYPSSKSDDC